ncbi:MAG TPA: hypothetical protein VKJ00_00995 [Thermoanaerobaculia bacterium]|nr:hypothetical protein [Thermoanaerobaculia bacterium]
MIRFAMASLLALSFAMPARAADPGASSPASLCAGDRLILGRLGEALVLSRATAGKIWPGWGLEKTPVVLYEPGRVAYLVNHPSPPSDFVRLESKFPLLGAVYVHAGRDPRFLANTSVDLGGIPTACIGFSTAAADPESPSLRFIALVYHEAFHAYQVKAGKTGKGAVESILMRYPELNAENLALAQVEQMILFQLIRFDDPPDPERVKQFLAVRQARLKAIGPEFLRADRGIEYQEGVPTYLEVRLLDEARKGAASSPGLGAEDPYALGFSLAPEIRVGDYLQRLLKFSSDTAATRNRAYGTGMALGLLLDRLGVDWKTAVLTTDKYLDEILAEAVPLSAPAAATALAAARKDYRYDDIFRLVSERTDRLSLERRAAGEAFMKQRGVQVAIHLPDAPVEVRAFDPMNLQPVDKSHTIHRRMLRLSFGESSFASSEISVMADLGEGPFDFRGLTFFLPKEDLHVETDFTALPLEPGTREFRSSLRLTSEGVSLQAVAGIVTVSPDGSKIDVALKR